MLRAARRAHKHFINFPVRWVGGLISFAAVLITLVNLRRLMNGLRDRSLRAHPERAPRESAALCYDRKVGRLARLRQRKPPAHTPQASVAATPEAAPHSKCA